MQRAVRIFELKLCLLERDKQNQYKEANERFNEQLINNGISIDYRNTHFYLFSEEQHQAEVFYYDWISRAHTGFPYAFWQMLDAAKVPHDNINSPLPIISHKPNIPQNYKSTAAVNKIFADNDKEPFPLMPVAIYYSYSGKVTFLLYEIKEDFNKKMKQQPLRLKAGYSRSSHKVHTQTELHKMKPVPKYKEVGRQNWQFGGDFPIFKIIK